MADKTFIDWPFFDDRHALLHEGLWNWSQANLAGTPHADVEATCRDLVARLGEAGWLGLCVPAAYGGANPGLDVRSLCLARETLAYHDGLADFSFAMQGLGTGAISLFGAEAIKREWLPQVASGAAIAGFALSEREAGSDVAAMSTHAKKVAGGYRISGEKTWISNGAIADVLTVFARTGDAPGARGISAFVLPTDVPGFEVTERIDIIAPHPLVSLRFNDCFVPDDHLIGASGEGFKIAMATLDVFRSTVGAAALGFARRANDEALRRASTRKLFGEPLSELQMTQASLADMALSIDASALLVYRAAWAKDRGQPRVTREAAMAKLQATESAQRVIDAALQLFGGQGVVSGEAVERLYREIRALRIYEGATEVQKVVIARQALAAFA
ncbi:MAG: acyl-CoA dehydrogenase [Phenylobacterium sp.]|uniref:acyl-CoA dehydrogenase family protein n=1 Tax=Phenylobacterium sp. TaxID=1871053 RepID=UPI001206B682|nr:acyl-CoA dehydrogenase family protein [Phenylobacterium sp.]TAJ73517.1 MAG: acyl-CoA dehydrogenase [Phenylobacterium sp.]